MEFKKIIWCLYFIDVKIKTIYGQDLNDYLGKHLDYDNEKNYEDCFDSFYNTLYPLIKKAWEEGKIELHAPDFK